LDVNNEKLREFSDKLYSKLKENNIDVLYDDTDQRAGVKFGSNDLIGIPLHVIVGQKNMQNNFIEIKCRKTSTTQLIESDKIENFLNDYFK
jgi:prolyl-tRNA synthetase